jgi:SGNH hydrolase-like domain, acetyltransferase AlgX
VKRTLFRIFVVAAACVIAVAGAEVALRVAGPRWLRARMEELRAGRAVLGETSAFEFIGYENGRFTGFRPRSVFTLSDPEFTTEVHITDWGTRVTGADAVGPDTIAFLGDSFTFGFGVRDSETFVSIACRTRHAACLNVSFPGSTLSMHLDLVERGYESWGRPRRIVFVFFAGNDLPELIADLDGRRQHAASMPTPLPRARQALGAVNAAINGSPLLGRLYSLQLAKSALRSRLTPGAMDLMFVTASGASGAFGRQAATALDTTMARLDALSTRLGFTPIFLMLPDRFQMYPAAMADKARYYGLQPDRLDLFFPQRLLASELDQRHIPWLDVLPCLDRADEMLYYRRDNHLTARGHEAVARCVLRSNTIPL